MKAVSRAATRGGGSPCYYRRVRSKALDVSSVFSRSFDNAQRPLALMMKLEPCAGESCAMIELGLSVENVGPRDETNEVRGVGRPGAVNLVSRPLVRSSTGEYDE